MINIGNRIIEMREECNLSQTALAKKAQIAQSTLSYIEKGESSPNIIQLDKICIALGITLNEFFNDTVPEYPPHIRELVSTVQNLKSSQIEILNQFIKSMTEEAVTEDELHLVAESPNKYEPIAAHNLDDPMLDLSPEAIEEVEELKRKRLEKFNK
jgi:transcriptional regulator with XRE-family HTH domain